MRLLTFVFKVWEKKSDFLNLFSGMSYWQLNQMSLLGGHAIFVLTQYPICMFTKLYCSLVVIIYKVCSGQECKKGNY